jgi:hypothetical protein
MESIDCIQIGRKIKKSYSSIAHTTQPLMQNTIHFLSQNKAVKVLLNFELQWFNCVIKVFDLKEMHLFGLTKTFFLYREKILCKIKAAK